MIEVIQNNASRNIGYLVRMSKIQSVFFFIDFHLKGDDGKR